MEAGKQLKLDIISLVNLKKISITDAQKALNVSERSVLRYLQQIQAKGPSFVLHGNLGRAPVNKTSSAITKKAASLMKQKYFDFNMTHALEKLEKDEGIKINRETFRKVCHKIGMVKKSHRRHSKVRKVRDRITQEGVMLQMDGSPHRWFGDKERCLIGAIDDATSEVLGAEFFESETTVGCMKVLKNIIEKKGIFSILYTDRAGIFGGPKRVNFAQVKRALAELGISVIYANSPEAKGRVERLWGTLQDRLVPEMRIRKIKSDEAANCFLQEEYLPNDHNKKFRVLARNLEPAWRPVPLALDLNQIFCIKDWRTVKSDHTYSLNGRMYKINSDFKHSIRNQKIEIRTYLDGTVKVYFADREIEVVQHHTQPQITLAETIEIIADKQLSFKVRKDGHIQFENKFYSVAEEYIGKEVNISTQEGTLLIYYRKKLIETHDQIVSKFVQASTKPEHLGPWQKALLPKSVYRQAASSVGVNCDKLIFIILQRSQGVVDNKNIWAIIDLAKEYQRSAIDEACAIAHRMGACDYRTVASVLRTRFKKRTA